MKILVVVDMQNDFITGALGSAEAQAVVPKVKGYIEQWLEEKKGSLYFTRDTHHDNYAGTQEGRNLPVLQCVEGSDGWEICRELQEYTLDVPVFDKPTFGCQDLAEYLQETEGQPDEIVLIGLCTDICVISNAMLLKAFFPETVITVVEKCCAGVTPESHKRALEAMQVCQIRVV